MKTKPLYIILALLLIAQITLAQGEEKGKVAFGVLAGANFQNINGKDWDGSKLENNLTVGYHAGVNVQIPLVPQFYFQPGVLFSVKGAKWTDETINRISYVELPLNVVYKGLLGSGYVMIGLGPYVGYAVMGKAIDANGDKTDIVFGKVVEVGADQNLCYYKAFDAGGNLWVGYEMSMGLFFQLNTQLGLININPEDKRIPDDQSAYKNTGFGLSVGYRF